MVTGDTVLGRSAPAILDPDGRVGQMITSLGQIRLLLDTGAPVILPGHGPVVTDPEAHCPGDAWQRILPAVASGLLKDSVVNVTALVTLDKTDLGPAVGRLPAALMSKVDQGLQAVLAL